MPDLAPASFLSYNLLEKRRPTDMSERIRATYDIEVALTSRKGQVLATRTYSEN